MQIFPGILFPARAEPGSAIISRVKYTEFVPNYKMYFPKLKNIFVQIFPGILFPAGAGAAIMDRVKYEPIMAPTSTTCRQADQKPLQGKRQKVKVKFESVMKVKVKYEPIVKEEAN